MPTPDAGAASATLPEALAARAAASPDHPALHFYGRAITYAALAEAVDGLAAWLVGPAGVRPGDRVLLDLQNSPPYVIAFQAVLRAGAVAVPLNPMYRGEEVSRVALDSGATVAIVGSELVDRFAAPDIPLTRIVVAHYADFLPAACGYALPDVLTSTAPPMADDPRLLAWNDAREPVGDLPAVAPDMLAVMPYTSGSTGEPKGCPHTHAAMYFTAKAQVDWYGLDAGDVVTAIQPLFHVAGMQGSMNAALIAGAVQVVMTRWNLRSALELFAATGVTFWNAPPPMVVDLLSSPDFVPAAFARLRLITGGGTAMPVAVGERLRDQFGITYVEAFGMSETMSPTHINPLDRVKPGSIGVPIADTRALIVDPDTQVECPAGETGELLVAGPQVMGGYWRNRAATEAAMAVIDGVRYLRTGDLARRDDDGYFYIVDRLKRMINASGFKVWPAEVEAMLHRHPAIADCCVIAAPDSYRGQTVRALLVRRADRAIDAAAVTAWLRERLAAFKVPRQIEFVDALPRTATNKVDWRALEAAALSSPIAEERRP